jgi:hypothetical protein
VYDGECGFCRAGVSWLAGHWRLPGQRVAWQDASLEELGLTEGQVRDRMWYVAPGLPPQGGAAAFAAWLASGGRARPRRSRPC